MSRFNLLDEPWIPVIKISDGEVEDVSITTLFQHAQEYQQLAGDSSAQDFVMLRMLLAILHTVFSRYNFEGDIYDEVEMGDRMIPVAAVDEDDEEDYSDALLETWQQLWNEKQFPAILYDYLETWNDRFFFFDEEYPFYQTPLSDIDAKTSTIDGKIVNRLISESNNKLRLFSPKEDAQKDSMTIGESVRWYLMLQGYFGTFDKKKYPMDEYDGKYSKGWVYDIGGIFLSGDSVFDTLMLNLSLVHPDEQSTRNIQRPCWEYSATEVIKRLYANQRPDNIAELYTNWSRAALVDQKFQENQKFTIECLKIPEVDHKDLFVEPMTMWKSNRDEEYTPLKQKHHQSMWRSFSLLMHSDGSKMQRKPGIIKWQHNLRSKISKDYRVGLNTISVEDDGNATSWMPTNELYDYLQLNQLVLVDIEESGWMPRIIDMVDITKKVINGYYKHFVTNILLIHGVEAKADVVNRYLESFFSVIDQPFRQWVQSIQYNDDKEDKIQDWYNVLAEYAEKESKKLMNHLSTRDYQLHEQGKYTMNTITSYNIYRHQVKKLLAGR